MGGHTQFGEFYSLSEAHKAWLEALDRYVRELGLYLIYGWISYVDMEKKYRLFMRFSK